MNKEEISFNEAKLKGFLNSQLSRGQMLKAAGVGAALAAVPTVTKAAGPGSGRAPFLEFPFFPQGVSSYTTEDVGTIATTALTAEYLAVTVLTAAVNNASALGLSGLLLDTVQAALTEEYVHLTFLRDQVGAKPLTTTFTVPDPKILTDKITFFSTLEVAENLFVAAYMTATREFAELGQPFLAKLAYQFGGTEAEHRVLVRAALALSGVDHTPPNNKAFETDLLLYVSDAAKILTALGFVGGSGTPAAYPGDAAAVAAAGPMFNAVIQKTPNAAGPTVIVTGPGDLTGERT